MSTPISRIFMPIMTHEAKVERYIDNHYHLEMIAENSKQLVEYQSSVLRLQHDAAIANIRGMAEIANRQDETNNLLSTLVGGIDYLNDNMNELNSTAYETLDAIQHGFQQIAEIMLQQQKALEQIADMLRRPYETKVLELLSEADNALRQGMISTGKDQQAEFADATRLLKDVLDNPIGSRNYVAWFQVGWLKWKYERNIAEAEEAFYQASRLSAPKADLYNSNSLRHMAYMQYHQKNYTEAYSTIQKALAVSPEDHDIRYDAARYAAKIGREDEALSLLDKCIDQQPQTIVVMFSEEDFLK